MMERTGLYEQIWQHGERRSEPCGGDHEFHQAEWISAQKRGRREEENLYSLWVLAIIGVVAAVAAIAYGVYRFFTPDYLEEFEDDFDDDFDDDFFEDEEDAETK